MVDDATFWRKELEEPCVLVLAKTTSMQSMIGGDAPAAAAAGLGRVNATNMNVSTGTPFRQSGGTGDYPGGSPHKKPRQHNPGNNGLLSTNRAGTHLCDGFQAGTCFELAPGMQGFRCGKDSSKSHQCAKCLSPDHGAQACNKPPAKQPNDFGKGNGKSGKGGKRGKGGKSRSQY